MHVSLSTIGVGTNVNAKLLNTLAYAGKGRYYHANRSRKSPRSLSRRPRGRRTSLTVEMPLAPKKLGDDPALAGIDVAALPPLAGYNRARAAAARLDAAGDLAQERAAVGADALRPRAGGGLPVLGHAAVGRRLDRREAGRICPLLAATACSRCWPRRSRPLRMSSETTRTASRCSTSRPDGGMLCAGLSR